MSNVVEMLKAVAAGLLLLGGAITVEEARALAGMAPMTDMQKRALFEMISWCKDRGMPMKQMFLEGWRWREWYGSFPGRD
jgi:hypothetical protein